MRSALPPTRWLLGVAWVVGACWLVGLGGRSVGCSVGRLLALVLACGLFHTPLALQEGMVPFCFPAHLLLLNVRWHDLAMSV